MGLSSVPVWMLVAAEAGIVSGRAELLGLYQELGMNPIKIYSVPIKRTFCANKMKYSVPKGLSVQIK